MIKEGRIVKGSICRIARYSHFTFNNEKEALIVLDIEVLQEFGIREKIGDSRGAPPSPRLRTASSAFDPPMWHADRSVYPVDAISPFAREWTIKVRVTSKSGMSGQGDCSEGGGQRGFRVALADGTGAIEAACWEGYDAFYKLLEVGSWYYISSPCGFSYGLDNLELRLEAGTIVERVEG
ncbi:uncharacterized protein DNG_04466 [Cephalotrichum gorgonifer]|uniref:OB domain-containing protein n=1 Tax=Cephalotrichum gorgonifer TaxID=2041049 RepID=A0AAE8MYK9_9PEZI|nr:uncharacterized protein DNG_04466 [Cephalotrichum gorgonifer]